MNRRSIIYIFAILVGLQGIVFIFLVNQNNSIEQLAYDKIELVKKNNLNVEKLKLNNEINLSNNFSIYENTKQWLNYSKNRIDLDKYRDKNPYSTPLTEVNRF